MRSRNFLTGSFRKCVLSITGLFIFFLSCYFYYKMNGKNGKQLTTWVIHTCFTWKENCYYWLLLMSHTFSHFCFLKRFLVLSKSWFNFFPPVVCISRSYFFILLSLSKVIGSTTSEDNFLTLLKPTYVMPNVCSDFPIFTLAFGKVNP